MKPLFFHELKDRRRAKRLITDLRQIRKSIYNLRKVIKAARLPKRRVLRLGRKPAKEYDAEIGLLILMTDVVDLVLNLAIVYGFDVAGELARHYPDECGYCRKSTCICHTLNDKPSVRHILPDIPDWAVTRTVHEFQEMLFRIYPKPQSILGLGGLTIHLAEELLELLEVFDVDGAPDRDQVILEAIDVLEKPFDIASVLGISLSTILSIRYETSRSRIAQLVGSKFFETSTAA